MVPFFWCCYKYNQQRNDKIVVTQRKLDSLTREMSSLKSQLSLRHFSDRLESLLNVYSCLKSLPRNSNEKPFFILSKIHGVGSLRKY